MFCFYWTNVTHCGASLSKPHLLQYVELDKYFCCSITQRWTEHLHNPESNPATSLDQWESIWTCTPCLHIPKATAPGLDWVQKQWLCTLQHKGYCKAPHLASLLARLWWITINLQGLFASCSWPLLSIHCCLLLLWLCRPPPLLICYQQCFGRRGNPSSFCTCGIKMLSRK